MRDVHIGCSGWNYRSWRGLFYPPGVPARRWLECYAARFDTVEVNATFYRLPTRQAVARWAEQTPEGFCFAIKASRYLTHIRRLVDVGGGIATFTERIDPLVQAGRLGPMLWQLPENFHRDSDRLGQLLAVLPPGRHAVELRHASWFDDDLLALLREHGVALVLGDHPQRPFQSHEATADWRYIRFHYGSRGRRGNYSSTEIDAWARRIHSWRSTHEVFAYFNNDWEGFAPRNAIDLRNRLDALAQPAASASASRRGGAPARRRRPAGVGSSTATRGGGGEGGGARRRGGSRDASRAAASHEGTVRDAAERAQLVPRAPFPSRTTG
jgi:uncharacterized protein YecE (DUF72 family)